MYSKKLKTIQIIVLILLLQNCHVLVINPENNKYYSQTNHEVYQKYGTAIWGKYEISNPRELSCPEGIRSIIIQRSILDFTIHYIIGGIYTIRTIEATCNPLHVNEEISKDLVKNKKLSLNSIYFNKNSAEILSESFPVLNQVANALKSEKFLKLIILGHTDLTGTNEQNLILSKNRADAVKRYLSENGIPILKIQTKGIGSSSPLYNATDEDSNRKNRRIEFQLE
jgi:outer membrane protein OmpA-like peptidoglycan-associated protein